MIDNPTFWRQAARSDLPYLRRALKEGRIASEKREAIFAALRERARELGQRFVHRVERLIGEFQG